MNQGGWYRTHSCYYNFGLVGVMFVCVGSGLPRVSLQSGYSFDRSLCFPVGGGGVVAGGGGGGLTKRRDQSEKLWYPDEVLESEWRGDRPPEVWPERVSASLDDEESS